MDTKNRKAEKRKAQKLSMEQTAREVSSSDRFWCARNGQFIYTIVCISRQDKEREGCVSCAQGTVVAKTFSQKHGEPDGVFERTVRRSSEIGGSRKVIQL